MAFSKKLCLLLGVAAGLVLPAPKLAASPASEMASAANNFLASLAPDQKAKATFELGDEQRFDWHFVPRARKGLPFKDMTSPQRLLAQALLGSGLSQRGFAKAVTIMSLEEILYELENKSPTRDSELYYVTVFGKPGQGDWAWRVEGHHLALNFTVSGNTDTVAGVTPSFFGANPALIGSGPRKGLRVLGGEEDLARQLVKSLTDEQRQIAVITNVAPRDIITGNARKASPLEPMGLSAAKLTDIQQQILWSLLKEYVDRARSDVAEKDLTKIHQAGAGKLFFAWAGGLEPGEGHYYRIQGPTFLMEYDNTQGQANHVHCVWRDFGNDFGGDLLAEHLKSVPHPLPERK